MKVAGKFFLFLALGFLGLHTVIPHEHEQVVEIDHFHAHNNPDSLLDYLKQAFHEDLGENHLEDFQISGIDVLFIPSGKTNFLFTRPLIKVGSTPDPTQIIGVTNPSDHFDLRGSPLV